VQVGCPKSAISGPRGLLHEIDGHDVIATKVATDRDETPGTFPRGNGSMNPFKSCSGLICSASGNELGVDDRKVLCVVTALEVERLVVDAVDMNHLAWI
jgi:hypothetical protein